MSVYAPFCVVKIVRILVIRVVVLVAAVAPCCRRTSRFQGMRRVLLKACSVVNRRVLHVSDIFVEATGVHELLCVRPISGSLAICSFRTACLVYLRSALPVVRYFQVWRASKQSRT